MCADNPKILDGRAASESLRTELKKRVAVLANKNIKPGLVTILVGEDPASKIYVNLKHKACNQVGIRSEKRVLAASISEQELLNVIREYNEDRSFHGILVQLPLPPHIDVEKVLQEIDVSKDVDGFHPVNLGNLVRGNTDNSFVSCTPAGILYLLKEHANINLEGLDAVIENRSNIVGKPLVHLLLQENVTVTVCHSRTKNLKEHTRRADLVITGIGKAKYFTKSYFKEGAIIVDVGTNRTDDGLVGDVDFDNVIEIASKISPPTGGVGPMTISMLLANTVKSAEMRG